MCDVCDDNVCLNCGEITNDLSGLCKRCRRYNFGRKPTKHERKLIVQRRKVNRFLGGNAKGFFAAAS